MSRENVEIVRRALGLATRRDDEATFALYDPEVEIHGQVDGDTYRGSVHGHDGLRRYFERWSEAWDSFDVVPTEFLDAGDYVFVGAVLNGRGRGSGVEVRMQGWQVWLIRGERAARCEEYSTRSEALE